MTKSNRAMRQMDISKFYLGIGGSFRLDAPYNQHINSFREWDHYNEPGTGEPGTLPAHRFWTWAKLNRPAEFPVGKCMSGIYKKPSEATVDKIFECDKPIIADIATKYPGAWHQIGNEPNWFPRISPKRYGYQFRKYRNYIRSLDPTAKVMSGSVLLMYRYKLWLRPVLDNYESIYGQDMPIDIWTVHPYALNLWPGGKKAAEKGIEKIKKFRAFIDLRCYKNIPIVIAEFSDAGGGNSVKELAIYAETFMEWIVKNKEQYNIVGCYWWGATTGGMNNAGLFNSNTREITEVGKAYIKHFAK